MIIVLIIIGIVALGALYYTTIRPADIYTRATMAFNVGNYKKAASLYGAINVFDSQEKYKECKEMLSEQTTI